MRSSSEFGGTPLLPEVEIVNPGGIVSVCFGRRPGNQAGGPFDPCDLGLVDPRLPRQRRRLRLAAREALGVFRVGLREHAGTLGDLLLGDSGMHVVRVRACSREPKRSGNSARYFSVLKWLSEYGLSFETCGLECVFVTPRSASKSATGFDVIDDPRSAWTVSCPGTIPCRA